MKLDELLVRDTVFTDAMLASAAPSDSITGEKRKTPELEYSEPPDNAAFLGGGTQVVQPVLEPPAKKAKKKGGGKSKFGKKGSKKSNGRPVQGALPGEQVEQRALTPAFRDSLEVLSEVLLSKTDRAAQIQLSNDRLTASSTKGYRMVRATTGPFTGAWYFEIKVIHLGETGHARLGWSTGLADLQAPVGYDTHSYGYRDIDGSKVHNTLREDYGFGYGEGDVIGCYIDLPGGVRPPKPTVVEFKGRPYLMETEVPQEPLKDSVTAFFKNGQCQGAAYWAIFGGQYFPAASLYTSNKQTKGAEVRFNFGPDWECPPSDWAKFPVPEPVSKLAAIELEEARKLQAGDSNGADLGAEQIGRTAGGVNGPVDGDVNGPTAGGATGSENRPAAGGTSGPTAGGVHGLTAGGVSGPTAGGVNAPVEGAEKAVTDGGRAAGVAAAHGSAEAQGTPSWRCD